MMKRILPGLIGLLFASFVGVSAYAQIDMSAEKRALIRELLDLSGGAAMAEQIAQLVLDQVRQNYKTMMQNLIAQRSDLSAEEQKRLLAQLESFERFAKQFSAKFPERINVPELLDTIYSPLYDKHFSEQELKEIIAFYRTPAGRKAISVMPTLMQEGMQATSQAVGPRILSLVQEIIEAERVGLEQ